VNRLVAREGNRRKVEFAAALYHLGDKQSRVDRTGNKQSFAAALPSELPCRVSNVLGISRVKILAFGQTGQKPAEQSRESKC
jgi:hypothetical protein